LHRSKQNDLRTSDDGHVREMGMANLEMSKGNMLGACMHYMKARKMSMMKSEM
jgi:hypothetical protein